MHTVTYFFHSTIYCEHQHIQIHIIVLTVVPSSAARVTVSSFTELILSLWTMRIPVVCHHKQNHHKYSYIHISAYLKDKFLEMEFLSPEML